ncbi:hypothetical protein DVH24_042288 [Malus domestica]|uniref:DDE Tnp4 domain-containing protein n=1 Tax=Malus domestica TaxID=3750 RepID=A0A498J0Z6_MALDO|nr:hypothetical protein DVH24_042288 [Malus domestica]
MSEHNDNHDNLEYDIDNDNGLEDIVDVENTFLCSTFNTKERTQKKKRIKKKARTGAKVIKQLDDILRELLLTLKKSHSSLLTSFGVPNEIFGVLITIPYFEGHKQSFKKMSYSSRESSNSNTSIVESVIDMIRHMRNFPFEKHVQIIVASMALHNFIGNHSDQEFQPYDDDDELFLLEHEEDHKDEDIVDENSFHRREIDVERKKIANVLISS